MQTNDHAMFYRSHFQDVQFARIASAVFTEHVLCN